MTSKGDPRDPVPGAPGSQVSDPDSHDHVDDEAGPAPSSGDVVHARFTKWGGGRHWEWRARYLRADEHGHWFFAPAGTVCSRPGVTFVEEDPWVSLVPREAGWVAGFYPRSKHIRLYVDMATPATWRQLAPSAWEVTMIDLDLDVVLGREGHLFVDDEDEFAVHQVELGYPPEIVELARRTSDLVHAAVASGAEPFARLGFAVLDATVAGEPHGP